MSDPLTVYISGRVTGQPRENTLIKFDKAAKLLYANSHNPVNPMLITEEGCTHVEAMKKLLPALLDCDAIMMLEDWEYSEGSMIELMLAKYVGKHIMFEEDFI